MDNWGYIMAAYTLTALSLGGYLWHLRQAERRLRGDQEVEYDRQ